MTRVLTKKTTFLALTVILAVIFGSSGVFAGTSDLGGNNFKVTNVNKSSQNVIKLGATVSKTGGTATEGTRLSRGYQMAIADINAAGGVDVGGTMYTLSLVEYDDQSNKDIAAQKYDTLIDTDHVDILLGPYGSSIVLSVAPKAESAGIPLIQAGGASDSIYKNNYQWIFGLYRVGSTYTKPIFSWLNETSKASEITKAALFVEGDSFSASVQVGALEFLGGIGLTGDNAKVYPHTSGDLDPIATQMSELSSSGGADMIIMIGHYGDIVKTAQEIYSKQLQPKVVYGTVGIAEPKFVTEVSNRSEQMMGFSQWVTNIPESKAPGITDFVSTYNSTYGEEPSYHAAGAYAAVEVVKEAVEAAGTFTDKAAVQTALKNLDVDTLWGHVKFSSTGVVEGDAYMVQVLDEKIETVYPTASKTADLVFPMDWNKLTGSNTPGFDLFVLFAGVSALVILRKKIKK